MELRTVEWKNGSVVMIDQTKLPNELVFVKYTDYNDVANAIRTLVVRGAPAIGVSGAFGMALAALQSSAETKQDLLFDLEKAKKILKQLQKHKSLDRKKTLLSSLATEDRNLFIKTFLKAVEGKILDEKPELQ